MFGTAYDKRAASLKSRQLNHLFFQFTNVPNRDWRLQGYLGNVITRFEVMSGVCAHLKSNTKAEKLFSELFSSEEKKNELVESLKAPDCKESRRVMKVYLDHLQFSGMNVRYGSFEPYMLKSKCFAGVRRYSCYSGFFTMAFNELDNPRSYRASFHTINNQDFPAVFHDACEYGMSVSDFVEKMKKGAVTISEEDIVLPAVDLSRNARARAAMENPMVYVSETKKLVGDVFSILFGLHPEHFFDRFSSESSRATRYFKETKGIFGHCKSALAVVEGHAKGTLHFHALLHGSLTPFALQEYANIPRLCKVIAEVLDTHFTSEVPSSVHVARLVKDKMRRMGIRPPETHQFHSGMLEHPDPCVLEVNSGTENTTNNE
jgi:hypothetical protein